MNKIVNLTQHPATPEQIAQGVVDLSEGERERLGVLLTFGYLPTKDNIFAVAWEVAKYSDGYDTAMIGGAPYLMGKLEDMLHRKGCTPVYAFSRRESVEELQTDGSVKKVNVFRHVGFVEV
jgi:hypothetical protein